MNRLRQQLDENGEVIFTVTGWSMWPLLRNNTDQVIVKKPPDRLKVGDVALYARADGICVLHRVMKATKACINGEDCAYIFCGDNQGNSAYESGIKKSNIIGIMTGFYRGRFYFTVKSPLYRLYSLIWSRARLLRAIIISPVKFIIRTADKMQRKQSGE